jgi:hypothetical protein
MFKGSLLFLATTVPELAFIRILVDPFSDARLVLGFLLISLVCLLLNLSIITRYVINVRRVDDDLMS